jgi:hypothetical protein
MTIIDAKWADSDHQTILALIDGIQMSIPKDPLNRHYAEIVRQGVSIADG